MITTSNTTEGINSPVRQIKINADLYDSSGTKLGTFTEEDRVISFEIERVGDSSKFFGYGICHRLNLRLIDTKRELDINTSNYFALYCKADGAYTKFVPSFYVTEVHRDENTNELSITAYDKLYGAANHTFSELNLEPPYYIGSVCTACANLLGISRYGSKVPEDDNTFITYFTEGANFDGTETIREVLDAAAEATQTIYFINNNNVLIFLRLGMKESADIEINKTNYFTLDSGESRRLATITHVSELGDNVSATTGLTGTTQYIRNNPFWDLRQDIGDLLNNVIAAVGGFTISQFECEWRGDFRLEVGDKISLTTKDNKTIISYLLDDVITYDGSFSQVTRWQYENSDSESESNPATLGDALKQTYARVDKANKEISIVASQIDETNKNISSLALTTEDITASVQAVEKAVEDGLGAVNAEIATLTQQAALSVTAEDVAIAITTELSNGVDKVTTATGFTFNQDGLTVSKSDSEISTQITENGMTVSKSDEIVLTANNEGVKAEDLHATTYLIIGTNSRFENYLDNRTGCFFIG